MRADQSEAQKKFISIVVAVAVGGAPAKAESKTNY